MEYLFFKFQTENHIVFKQNSLFSNPTLKNKSMVNYPKNSTGW